MSKNSRELKKRRTEYAKRIREMEQIRAKLQCAYSAFDSVTQPDIMDACIFEISALQSRYNHAVANIRNFSLNG